jgi:hypothetical protein
MEMGREIGQESEVEIRSKIEIESEREMEIRAVFIGIDREIEIGKRRYGERSE